MAMHHELSLSSASSIWLSLLSYLWCNSFFSMRIFLCISLSISVSRRFDVDGSADDVEGCAGVGDGARGGGEDGSSAENVEATTVGMVASVAILIAAGSATAEAGAVSAGACDIIED